MRESDTRVIPNFSLQLHLRKHQSDLWGQFIRTTSHNSDYASVLVLCSTNRWCIIFQQHRLTSVKHIKKLKWQKRHKGENRTSFTCRSCVLCYPGLQLFRAAPRHPAERFHLQLTRTLPADTRLSGQQVTWPKIATSQHVCGRNKKKTIGKGFLYSQLHELADILGLIWKVFVWRWSLWEAVTV